MEITYRPIERWPGELTPWHQRRPSPFSAAWGSTLRLLERELAELEAVRPVMQVALAESDFRLDGKPRARAVAAHPGVILAFDSKHGPLQYAVDTFTAFQDNVRAIALALEALRKVDRYGVTRNAEQYRGWRALPSGDMSEEEAWRVVVAAADLPVDSSPLLNGHDTRTVIRRALARTHPDAGGDAEAFHRVQAAREVLEHAG